MQLNVSIDIADAVQEMLNGMGITACARPLPHDLEDRLPLVLVEAIPGGSRRFHVLDRHAVRLSAWAGTGAEARAIVALAMAYLENCVGGELGGVPCYRVTQSVAMPYEAMDPDHPDIPHAECTAHLWVRTKTIES